MVNRRIRRVAKAYGNRRCVARPRCHDGHVFCGWWDDEASCSRRCLADAASSSGTSAFDASQHSRLVRQSNSRQITNGHWRTPLATKSLYAIYMANRFRHIASLWDATAQWLHEDGFQTLTRRIRRTEDLPDRNRIDLRTFSVRACPSRWRRCQCLARPRVGLVVPEHLPDAKAAICAVIESGDHSQAA